jgi:hypothetical protein
MTSMQDIDDKITKIRAQGVEIEDTDESYMAELRVDIDTLQEQIAHIGEMVQSQETKFYNYKLGLTILSVFVFILYIIS